MRALAGPSYRSSADPARVMAKLMSPGSHDTVVDAVVWADVNTGDVLEPLCRESNRNCFGRTRPAPRGSKHGGPRAALVVVNFRAALGD